MAHRLAPLPRCAAITRPAASSRRQLAQPAGDIFVGQAMKAVAPHALVMKARAAGRSASRPPAWCGERRCRNRRPAAGSAAAPARPARRRDCAARAAAPAAFSLARVAQRWPHRAAPGRIIAAAAMDNAMPGRDQPCAAQMVLDPLQHRLEQHLMAQRLAPRPTPLQRQCRRRSRMSNAARRRYLRPRRRRCAASSAPPRTRRI